MCIKKEDLLVQEQSLSNVSAKEEQEEEQEEEQDEEQKEEQDEEQDEESKVKRDDFPHVR